MAWARVWHDHCIQRVTCPWSVQYKDRDGRLRTAHVLEFRIEFIPSHNACQVVSGMIDPPTLEYYGVAGIAVLYHGDPSRWQTLI